MRIEVMDKKTEELKTLTLCSPENFLAKSNDIITGPFEFGYHSIYQIYTKQAKIERKAKNFPLANALHLCAATCAM